MDLNRRNFLGGAAFAAAAGLSSGASAQGGGKETVVGKRRFVAACPNATDAIARTPGPIRVMMIGAHPDDTDITCGGLAVKLIDLGYKVKFVSITDGRMGHHLLSPDQTAKTRRAETLEAEKRFGLDGYDIYGYPDCGLIPSYEARCLVARNIRAYEPDFIITHRTCDYHADHRAAGQLVMDAGYLLGVPHWVPEAKAQRRRPVILYMTDPFTYPRELRPDVMVDVEPFLGRWCHALDAQVSQFYDWLPWDKGTEAEVAALGDRSDVAARNAYLMKYWAAKKMRDAARFAADWKAQYPSRPVPKYMEAYEVSEYGRAPTEADLKAIVGES